MTSYSSYSRYSYRLTYETVQKCYEMFTKSSVPLFSSSQIRQFKRQLARSQFHKHHDICLDKLIVELRFYKNIEILNDILPYDIIKQLERRYLICLRMSKNTMRSNYVLPPHINAFHTDDSLKISLLVEYFICEEFVGSSVVGRLYCRYCMNAHIHMFLPKDDSVKVHRESTEIYYDMSKINRRTVAYSLICSRCHLKIFRLSDEFSNKNYTKIVADIKGRYTLD